MIGELFKGILESSFIQGFITIIISVITGLTNLILLPFAVIISTFLPSLDNALSAVASYFTYVSMGIGWAISAFAIPPVVLALIASYTVFAFYLPFQTWGLKLALSWKKTLWG